MAKSKIRISKYGNHLYILFPSMQAQFDFYDWICPTRTLRTFEAYDTQAKRQAWLRDLGTAWGCIKIRAVFLGN